MNQAGYATIRAGMDVELPMREAYNVTLSPSSSLGNTICSIWIGR